MAFRGFLRGRLRVEGLENVPSTGPLLLVCNHLGYLDPPLFSFCRGTLHVMGMRELFEGRVMRWIITGCNCFPVSRGTIDRRALRTSLDILASGGRLLIFPEGGLSNGMGMLRAKPGVGFLLRHSGATLLPCAITGTENVFGGRRFPRRRAVTLRFGAPIAGVASADESLQSIADRAGASIAALLPPRYRGYYATADDDIGS
jgi:1-acyl-sn-glycerol-3-phosphate acyltransferase